MEEILKLIKTIFEDPDAFSKVLSIGVLVIILFFYNKTRLNQDERRLVVKLAQDYPTLVAKASALEAVVSELRAAAYIERYTAQKQIQVLTRRIIHLQKQNRQLARVAKMLYNKVS